MQMKAVVYNSYGSPEVLHIEEVSKPTPGDNDILVKVYAAGVNSGDARLRAARFPKGFGLIARLIFGILKPKKRILGVCFSGVVESVGKNVTKFKIGEDVFGMTGGNMGTYAEYLTINENKAITLKPNNMSYEEAAAISFGGTTALYFLKNKAKIQQGQKILINGASGAVGTNAIQVAKYYGADVTGVCSTSNVDLVKSIGADQVIDYKKENLFDIDKKYDIVMDTVGNISIGQGKKLLAENGVLALVVAGLPEMIRSGKKVITGSADEKKEDLELLCELFSKGKLKVLIDKVYNFEDIVEAHRHADTGHKRGNIVLRFFKTF